MKKLWFIIIILLLMPYNVSAKSLDSSVNNMFIEFNKIIDNNEQQKFGICIDYSIEILSFAPKSLESYYVLSMLPGLEPTDSVNEKITNLKKKFFEDINNIETNTIEKTILMLFLARGVDSISFEEKLNTQKKTIEWLNNVTNNCSNKDYSAIANVLLFFDKENGYDNTLKFKEKFINHPFMPLVLIDIIAEYSIKGDCITAIKEIEKLIEKYQDIITPYGCKLKYEYYAVIAFNYIQLKDKENTKKIIDQIENEEPTFHSLKKLKNKLNEL